MIKTDIDVTEEFDKPNGEIGKRKAVRHNLDFDADAIAKADIVALYFARLEDAEFVGPAFLRTEIIGDTLRVRIGNIHPGHVQKLEQAFAPHEKPAQATPKV